MDILRARGITVTVPITWTGYRSMRDVIALMESICDTYDRADLQPHDGQTFCNVAVGTVAAAMGCGDLAAKNADEILDVISHSADWSLVTFEKAQDMANAGSFLVAGLTSVELHQAHGHVVVIRPGKSCYSGKWGATPRCLNVGAENFVARAKRGPLTASPCGLNEAFVELPKIYVWRKSL